MLFSYSIKHLNWILIYWETVGMKCSIIIPYYSRYNYYLSKNSLIQLSASVSVYAQRCRNAQFTVVWIFLNHQITIENFSTNINKILTKYRIKENICWKTKRTFYRYFSMGKKTQKFLPENGNSHFVSVCLLFLFD